MGGSKPGKLIRQQTKLSLIATKYQRRETCLKKLKESALALTNGENVTQMDTLLRDQVMIISSYAMHLYT